VTLAPCPNCGGKTVADQDRFYGGVPRWQVACDQAMGPSPGGNYMPNCGYRGPFAIDLDEAVRKHNKISQNCGACP
jgi:ribosomal protein S27AE